MQGGDRLGFVQVVVGLPDCPVLSQYQHHYLLLPPALHLLPGPRERLVRELGRVPALERAQEAEQLRRGGGGVLSAHPPSRAPGSAMWHNPSPLLGFWSSQCGHCLVVVVFISLRCCGWEGFCSFLPAWEWEALMVLIQREFPSP